ncbi:DUF6132 family protein [soil metagenome]
MKKIIRKNILTISGAVVGAIAGFFYWKFIGCSTGTSNGVRMTLYGALLGGLLLNIFQPKTNQQQHGK